LLLCLLVCAPLLAETAAERADRGARQAKECLSQKGTVQEQSAPLAAKMPGFLKPVFQVLSFGLTMAAAFVQYSCYLVTQVPGVIKTP
jgi:hypothetical protein